MCLYTIMDLWNNKINGKIYRLNCLCHRRTYKFPVVLLICGIQCQIVHVLTMPKDRNEHLKHFINTFQSVINSKRRSDYIKNFNDLITVLEKATAQYTHCKFSLTDTCVAAAHASGFTYNIFRLPMSPRFS